MKVLKAFAKDILNRFGYEIVATGTSFRTEKTDKKTLHALMRSLYPMSTDKELIRLGPRSDGGYLIPDDLIGIEACFSPGVSTVSGFEKACAELGMKVFLADKSVDRPADSHPLFRFTQRYVGVTTSDDHMTMDDWVAESLPASQNDLMLQIDIEGDEYEAFLGMSDSLMRRFRIMIAEFHSLDQLWSQPFFRLASRAFEKIEQTHTCIHIHPNNCCGLLGREDLAIPRVAEFTFLRNDRIRSSSYATVFPHPLDFDNTGNPHLPLPHCWYGVR